MPVTPTYPGVYVEEIPSDVRTITGVSTSVAAFVGYTARGPDNRAVRIFSFADFQRTFGGLASDSELSYAVQQFFDNGGSDAYVVRVPKNNAAAATVTLPDKIGTGAKQALTATARSKGAWANNVILDVDYTGIDSTDTKAYNLTITDLETGLVETFSNVTQDSAKANYVEAVINDDSSGSSLVSVKVPNSSAGRPVESGTVGDDLTFTNGDLAGVDTTKVYNLTLSSDHASATINGLIIPFIGPGEVEPGSVLGVCQVLEQKINHELQVKWPAASVRCVPSASGQGIRVLATFPGALDTTITFGAPAQDNADAALKLSTGDANMAHYWLGKGKTIFSQAVPVPGNDGTILPQSADLIGNEANFTGMFALDKVDLFNLLCIPDATRAEPGNPNKPDASNVDPNTVFGAAMTYCKKRRAFLLIDPPPDVNNLAKAVDWKSSGLTVSDRNGAAYFPRIRARDPRNHYKLRTFAPCGVIAGLYSRIDTTRGVWKAPAGVEATLTNVAGLAYDLSDMENGVLNQLGLNCLRQFPVYGRVAWGSRTLEGADQQASEWKYVPVRRLALYIEESLFRGTKWVVFEPNDEPLWAQIRLNVGAFMNNLYRQHAFQGKSPRDAYFVKCDGETTTQTDINLGIVNIVVGFAPLKPAEFVIIKLQQMAGQIAA